MCVTLGKPLRKVIQQKLCCQLVVGYAGIRNTFELIITPSMLIIKQKQIMKVWRPTTEPVKVQTNMSIVDYEGEPKCISL